MESFASNRQTKKKELRSPSKVFNCLKGLLLGQRERIRVARICGA
jgi:hypothetical protein